MDEVLSHALVRQPVPIVWEEEAKPLAPLSSEEETPGAITH
jgi:ATP-dependent Lon protease